MTRLDGSSCLWNFPAVTAFRVAFKLAEPQPLRKPRAARPGRKPGWHNHQYGPGGQSAGADVKLSSCDTLVTYDSILTRRGCPAWPAGEPAVILT